MAPDVFTRVGQQSAVTEQPVTAEGRVKALQALLSCPTCDSCSPCHLVSFRMPRIFVTGVLCGDPDAHLAAQLFLFAVHCVVTNHNSLLRLFCYCTTFWGCLSSKADSLDLLCPSPRGAVGCILLFLDISSSLCIFGGSVLVALTGLINDTCPGTLFK